MVTVKKVTAQAGGILARETSTLIRSARSNSKRTWNTYRTKTGTQPCTITKRRLSQEKRNDEKKWKHPDAESALDELFRKHQN